MTKHKKPDYHYKPIILSEEAKKGFNSSPEAPTLQVCCYKCKKVLEGYQIDFWRGYVKKGYKLGHIDCEKESI